MTERSWKPVHVIFLLKLAKAEKANMAYENIRLKPDSVLAEEILQGFLEDYISL